LGCKNLPKKRKIGPIAMVYENEMNPMTQNQQGVCHDVALPFTLKIILKQKKNYGNSNI
jgi:hypothetical protein